MSSDPCEVCGEELDYCLCWRCSDCERLFPADVESGIGADGDVLCAFCKLVK